MIDNQRQNDNTDKNFQVAIKIIDKSQLDQSNLAKVSFAWNESDCSFVNCFFFKYIW